MISIAISLCTRCELHRIVVAPQHDAERVDSVTTGTRFDAMQNPFTDPAASPNRA